MCVCLCMCLVHVFLCQCRYVFVLFECLVSCVWSIKGKTRSMHGEVVEKLKVAHARKEVLCVFVFASLSL